MPPEKPTSLFVGGLKIYTISAKLYHEKHVMCENEKVKTREYDEKCFACTFYVLRRLVVVCSKLEHFARFFLSLCRMLCEDNIRFISKFFQFFSSYSNPSTRWLSRIFFIFHPLQTIPTSTHNIFYLRIFNVIMKI